MTLSKGAFHQGIMRRGPLALAGLAVVTACVAGSAQATFPGSNGPIVFRADNFQTGLAGPLTRVNPNGSHVTVINRRHAYFSDFRPDGELIAIDVIQRDLDTHIAVLEPDGSDFRFITSGRGVHDAPAWSPNGRRLVFNHSFRRLDDPKFQTRLWTVRANGTHKRPLPMSHRGFDVEPKFSPGGRWVVFTRLRPPDFDQAVFIVSTRGKHLVRRLTPWRTNSEHPTWSPDGKWILFNNTPNGTIQAIRPNGADRHTIVRASVGFGGHKPSFSPDGQHIVFMCENQGTLTQPPPNYNQDICVMDADGHNIVHITKTPRVYENYPAWGPKPQ
jgi:Tol biopolymer transport system component